MLVATLNIKDYTVSDEIYRYNDEQKKMNFNTIISIKIVKNRKD